MTTFRELTTWCDQGLQRVLPLAQGEFYLEQLARGCMEFQQLVESGRPFSLIRLGDSELVVLGAGLTPFTGPDKPVQQLLNFGGLERGNFEIRPLLIDAVERSDLIGLHQNWDYVTAQTFVILHMLRMPVPLPRAIEVHTVYALLTNGMLFDFLQGKKVLLIGSLANELKTKLQSGGLPYTFLKKLDSLHALQTPPREEFPYTAYDQVLNAAVVMRPDVALVAFGTLAKPLCVALRDQGITAIDVGFCFDALLGNVERKERPVLRDVDWIE